MFASPEAFPLINGFKVVGEDLCPTHSALSMLLDIQEAQYSVFRAKKLLRLSALVSSAFTHRFGLPPTPLKPGDILLPDAMDDTQPHGLPHPFVRNLISTGHKAIADAYAARENRFVHDLKDYMDACFTSAAPHLREQFRSGATDMFWEGWWNVVEQAACSFASINGGEPSKWNCGRGKNLIRKEIVNCTLKHRPCGAATTHTPDPVWLMHLATQRCRCKHLAACLKVKAGGRTCGDKLANLEGEIASNRSAILKFAHWQLDNAQLLTAGLVEEVARFNKPQDIIDGLHSGNSSLKMIFAIELGVCRYEGLHTAHLHRIKNEYTAARSAFVQANKASSGQDASASKPTLPRPSQG